MQNIQPEELNEEELGPPPYAAALIHLLHGSLCSDDQVSWRSLLRHIDPVRNHFRELDCEVIVVEQDGYAFLRQYDHDEHLSVKHLPLPRLQRQGWLSQNATLLCTLLREQLLDFETNCLDTRVFLLSRDHLHQLLLPFFVTRTNAMMVRKKIDTAIMQVVQAGFLKVSDATKDPGYFEVQRVLKAKFPVDTLDEIRRKFEAYWHLPDEEISDEEGADDE